MVSSHARKKDARRVRGRGDNHRQAVEKARARSRISTGLAQLDTVLGGGLQPGHLTVLAARTAMGKSMLGLTMAMHCARDLGRPALITSLEMGHHELFERIIAAESGIPTDRIRRREVTEEERGSLREAGERMKSVPLHIGGDRSTPTTADIEHECRRTEERTGRKLELLLVDYLGLMGSRLTRLSREEEVEELVAGLRQLTDDRNMAVILVEQLTRATESRDDHRPRLEDMTHQQQLCAHAQTVVLLYRDAYYHPRYHSGDYRQPPDPTLYPEHHFPRQGLPEPVQQPAELHVALHRHGTTGVAHAEADLSRARFFDTGPR